MDKSLLERVECLERRNKILLGLLLLLTVVFGIILPHEFENASASKPPERFVASSIEVNKLVAHSIEVTDFLKVTGGALEVNHENGKYGKNSVSLEATHDGWVVLGFQDLKGDPKAFFLLTPSGQSTLSFCDHNNKVRLELGVLDYPIAIGEDEQMSFQLFDANHNVIWQPNVKNPY